MNNSVLYFLQKLLPSVFGDLSEYDVPPMPDGKELVKSEAQKDDDPNIRQDKSGRWRVNNVDGTAAIFDYDRLKGQRDHRGRIADFQDWDFTYLQQQFPNGFDEALARLMKLEWSTPNENGDYPSNQDITDRHTHDGITGDGFSKRNVTKYTAAFNAAEKSRLQEAEQKDSTPPPMY